MWHSRSYWELGLRLYARTCTLHVFILTGNEVRVFDSNPISDNCVHWHKDEGRSDSLLYWRPSLFRLVRSPTDSGSSVSSLCWSCRNDSCLHWPISDYNRMIINYKSQWLIICTRLDVHVHCACTYSTCTVQVTNQYIVMYMYMTKSVCYILVFSQSQTK